jgi:glutathione-regulated potassium-efflux system ancillary protein KefF
MPHPSVLLLIAHPDLRLSRVNTRLMQSARAMPAGHRTVEVRDLYALYPDYVIDVATEQAACERADLIVWVHPVHWYGMPPLMKLWLDEVLTLGWAYGGAGSDGGDGGDGGKGEGGQRLNGKDLWAVLSTGGTEEAYRPTGYNRYFFDAFLPPYEQTAALCGMRFLPPLILHGAHQAAEAEVLQHVQVFTERLSTYPDWPEMDELADCPTCQVPPLDRPQEA